MYKQCHTNNDDLGKNVYKQCHRNNDDLGKNVYERILYKNL